MCARAWSPPRLSPALGSYAAGSAHDVTVHVAEASMVGLLGERTHLEG